MNSYIAGEVDLYFGVGNFDPFGVRFFDAEGVVFLELSRVFSDFIGFNVEALAEGLESFLETKSDKPDLDFAFFTPLEDSKVSS